MANGQQKAQQNVDAFLSWAATQSDDNFKEITFRGQLNRLEIAKAIGCGKSALNQNPALREALKTLEDNLRKKGILPPLTQTAKANENKPKEYDQTVNRNIQDNQQKTKLEVENIELKAEIKLLEKKLERFREHSETLDEMGILPR
jgi:predicted RNase H-like nuclease (RuvC/YqgF family)